MRWLITLACACGPAPSMPRTAAPAKVEAVAPNVRDDVRLVPETGHQATIAELMTTPDGRHIATLARDRVVRVFRADGLREIARFYRTGKPATRIALADDGARVAASYDDATVVYDVRSGAELARIPTETDAGRRALGIPSSDRCIVFDGPDLLVWRHGLSRWRTGKTLVQLSSSRYPCVQMGFVGPKTLVVHTAMTLIYGDVATKEWTVGPRIDGFSLAFGHGVVAWGGRNSVQMWRVGDPTTTPLANASPFNDVAFIDNGAAIVHVDPGQAAERIDVATGAGSSFRYHIRVAPLGIGKAVGADDNNLCVLDTASGAHSNCLASTTGAVRTLAVSNSSLLVSAGDAPVRRWSSNGMEADASVSAPGWQGVAGIGGDVVARVGDDGLTVRANGAERLLRHQNQAGYQGVAVSPNGALVATIWRQDLLRFDIDGGRHQLVPAIVPRRTQPPRGFNQYTPDVTVSRNNWGAFSYRRMAYREDAAVLAVTADDQIVLVRDDKVVATLDHGGVPVTAIAFRPSTTELVAGFADGAVVSWNTDAPTAPIRERTSPAAVAALAFDGSGTSLLVVSGEHFETGSKSDAHVYGVRAGEVVSVAARRRSGLLAAVLADR